MNNVGLKNSYRSRSNVLLRNATIAIVAITIFWSIDPFFAWASFAGGFGVTLLKALQIASMVLMFVHLPMKTMPAVRFVCGLAMVGVFFFYCFFTGRVSGTTHPLLIGNILVYLFYALTAMSDRDILLKSYKLLRTIFAVILGYTVIIHILILLQFPIPYQVLQSGEAGRVAAGQQVYQNYLGCLLINSGGSLMYRFTSVFTEPGVIGTFCAFFLAADDLKISKSKQNQIFLISGILSLSVAFFVLIVIAYAIKSLRNGGRKFFFAIMALLVVYFIFINIDFGDSVLSDLQARFIFTEDGLSGDNRMHEEAEAEYQAFLESDWKTVLFGYGYPKVDPLTGISAWQYSASYKESVYCLGFVGYGLMIAWFIIAPIVCYKSTVPKQNYLMYAYMAIFIASQYQRPYMKSLFLVYILMAGCVYAQQCAAVEDSKT